MTQTQLPRLGMPAHGMLDLFDPERHDGAPAFRPECGSFSARRLASRLASRDVVLCEADASGSIPEARQRRVWRERLEPVFGERSIILFTDSAHSAFVWTWRVETRWPSNRVVEYRVPPREMALRHALGELVTVPVPPDDRDDPRDLALLKRLAELLGRTNPPEAATDIEIHLATSSVGDPDALRWSWKDLARITVYDPRCGDDWILQAARLLEPLYLGRLERIRGVVDDAFGARIPRRPEFLRDLRTIVDLADDPRRHATPALFVRRLLVQHTLFATGDDASSVVRCRRLLLEYAETPWSRAAFLDVNVRLLRPGPRRMSPMATSGGVGRPPPGPTVPRGAPTEEEHAILSSVLALVRARRLRREGTTAEFVRAAGPLERRCRRLYLSARLPDTTMAHLGSADRLALAYPWLPFDRDFLMIREDDGWPG